MRTIAIANHKGGSGKTTTAVNLSACLAEMKYQVLLIDLDPQSHATLSFGIELGDDEPSVFWAMQEPASERAYLAELARPVAKNLSLVPSSRLPLSQEEALLSRENRLTRLRELIGQVATKFDFVIIDCPPALGILTQNAFMASQSVILPVETSFYAMNGVSRVLDTFEELARFHHHKVEYWAVATLFDKRTALSRDILEELRRFFRNNMMETVVRLSIHLREASSHGEPVTVYANTSRGCQDYCDLAEEFLIKVAHRGEEPVECCEEVILLAQIHGNGRETLEALRQRGITSLGKLRNADAGKLAHHLGITVHATRQMITHAARLHNFPQQQMPMVTTGQGVASGHGPAPENQIILEPEAAGASPDLDPTQTGNYPTLN